MAGVFVIVALLSLSTAAAASPSGTFTQVELQGVVTNLADVACWHSQVCFAVGQEEAGQGRRQGVVLSSTNGSDWVSLSIPAATGLLWVSCLSARRCVAVGSGSNNQGVVVATTNGSTWAPVAVPAGTVSLNSISCSANTCVAVGSVLVQDAYETSVIGTSDGGTSWSNRPLPQARSEAYAVDCIDATHCWVAGSGAYVTHDGGSTWQTRDPSNGCETGGTLCAPTYSVLDAVTFVSPLDGWTAGGDQCGGEHVTQCSGVIFHTTDGGATWTQWDSYALAHYPFVDDIACTTDVSCTAVAQTFHDTDILTTSDGTGWQDAQALGVTLNAVACLSPSRCVVVGSDPEGSGYIASTGSALTSTPAPPRVPVATSQQSTIASALAPINKAFPLDRHTLLDALITIVAMVLVTFPAQLFNRTLDENRGEIRAIAIRRAPFLVTFKRVLRRMKTGSGTAGFVVVLALGSVIGGLNDPHFGLNGNGVETLIAVMCSFVAGVALWAGASLWYRRARDLGTEWKFHAVPDGLLVAIVCVVVSRLTHFEPGYLYGVIAGVAFTSELAATAEGHDVALGSLAVLAGAVLAWTLLTPVNHAATGSHPNPVVLVVDTFLAGLFVSGVVGTVINLLPLEFLPGSAIARWHKGVWAAIFSAALFLMVQVMLLPSARGSRIGDAPFVTTIVLFVVFGALSIAFNRYFARRHDGDEQGGPEADKEEATMLGESSLRPGPGTSGPR